MKEHAKLQLQEFYNARSKLLDNLPKIEPKESMESGVQGMFMLKWTTDSSVFRHLSYQCSKLH